ncbi:MAG: hypothetical protein DHS80DRAFT_25014 [Piptocephalis tieghemiana]|nr:MAG: hypothetical protein DHS80DRAFT_25014 [Piptocephalis tieghemiana]
MSQSQKSPSGIHTLPTPDGSRYIPESRRPDGSIRPARRVKEGYVPPEDIARYTVRRGGIGGGRGRGLLGGRSSRTPNPTGVGEMPLSPSGIMMGSLEEGTRSRPVPSPFDDDEEGNEEAQVKKGKEEEGRRRGGEGGGRGHFHMALQGILKETVERNEEREEKEKKEEEGKEREKKEEKGEERRRTVDPERRAKTIKKKLRQIKEIQNKIEKNEEVLPEQQIKLERVKALEEELASLTL